MRATLVIAAGLGLVGLAGFVFLALAGRSLGPAGSAPVSVAWTILNGVGIGLWAPLEQQTARLLAAVRARGTSTGRAVPSVVRYRLAALAFIVLVALAFGSPLARIFFAGNVTLLWLTVAALVTFAVEYFARGVLAGTGQFVRYGAQLAADGLTRIVGSVIVFATPGAGAEGYLMVMVLAPLVATAATVPPGDLRRAIRGEPVPSQGSVLPLVSVSVTSQLLANAGPLLIAVLTAPGEDYVTGNFVAAVTVARIPLFLFAAIQAVFLPTLSALVARGDRRGFVAALVRAGSVTAVLAIAGVLGIALLGTWIMTLIYGPAFEVSPGDMTLVAVSGALFMIAQLFAQAMLAHRRDLAVAGAWMLGLAALALTALIDLPTTTRTALALVVGSGVAAVGLALLTASVMARWRPGESTESKPGGRA